MQLSRFTIRTSDRRTFRRCYRKWGLQSSMKLNLQRSGTEQNIHFWFGSGIHFALEDYHGYNRFGDPRKAFKAYYNAFKKESLPEMADAYYELGIGMLAYYLDWLPRHNKDMEFETAWLLNDNRIVDKDTPGARPATEMKFYLDLGLRVIVDVNSEQIICEYTPEEAAKLSAIQPVGIQTDEREDMTYWYPVTEGVFTEVVVVPVHYHGTIDKIVKDKYGRIWIMDYKTAKSADTNKLDTDDQISAYIWAAEQWLQQPIYGFVYLQLTKEVAKAPKRLKNGDLSVDKKQRTTYQLVKEEIIKDYGSVQEAPNKIIEFLNAMAEYEVPEGDRFIRWDFVQRSREQIISTYNHIMGEARMMINPHLYLYPNPTRDCIWDCPMREICLAMDDGRNDEVKFMLEHGFSKRPRDEDGDQEKWQERIVYPGDEATEEVEEDDFSIFSFDVVLPEDTNNYFGEEDNQ